MLKRMTFAALYREIGRKFYMFVEIEKHFSAVYHRLQDQKKKHKIIVISMPVTEIGRPWYTKYNDSE